MLAQALTQNQQPQNLPVFGNLGMNLQPPSGIPINQYHVYENQPRNDHRMAAQVTNSSPENGDKVYASL